MSRLLLRSRAPLRVSFAGGGTDVPPFPAEEGGLVLNACINRYAYGTLVPRPDGRINVESLDLGVAASYGTLDQLSSNGDLKLAEAAIRSVATGTRSGFDLFLHTSAPPGSGLGASSALVVAMIGLLAEHERRPLTQYELAELACVVERKDLALKGGQQDQYAAVFGGFNFIEFDRDRVVVNPLRVPPDTLHELEYSLLLCFTGGTRASDRIIEDQTARYNARDEDTVEGLRAQKQLATEMKDCLLRGRLAEFGSLLGQAWKEKKRMSPRISTPFIDELYDEALREGALGGKVTGAGGGGYMLVYCPFDRKHRVRAALERMGASPVDFAFDERGLVRWSHAHD